MLIRNNVGIAVLAQSISLGLLNIATNLHSIVSTCRTSQDCVSNIVTSTIFFLLVVGWFGFLALLGFALQATRNRRLALLLIGAELCVLFVASINIRGHVDKLSLITSIIDVAFAILVILLSVKILRSGSARIVPSRARRVRRESGSSTIGKR